MPPAISDDEASDLGDIDVPITTATTKRAATTTKTALAVSPNDDDDDDDDNEMLDVVGDDGAKGEQDEDGEEGDDNEENLDEDEYIVEKILAHVLEADGSLKYKVKWEGYEKRSDQTWEEEGNLRENAAGVLDEYLESVGGRDKILEEAQTALKTKKRGRPSTGTPNGTKRRRNDSHPASASPPASSRAWKPPQGSWEDAVESIDACHDENTGKLTVYLTWKDGQKTQHDTKVIYSRCPQKMLQFYERHVKIVPTTSDAVKDE
ncbi:heterochromatin protein one [Xylaria longipes]|nr:heterochromatin protein one [Xylaria longipes]